MTRIFIFRAILGAGDCGSFWVVSHDEQSAREAAAIKWPGICLIELIKEVPNG
jgi:hypothetical protein